MAASAQATIYTDGAAKGNPGPAGWCWWINERRWAAGGWERATNNVAELTAVLEALKAVAHRPDVHITIVTDSTYVINTFKKFIHGYRRNGWKTTAGKPVANAEIIRDIDQHIARRGGVSWKWTRGHAGAHGNTQADAGASAAAEAYRQGRQCPNGPGIGIPDRGA